jgi:hypothetical protein
MNRGHQLPAPAPQPSNANGERGGFGAAVAAEVERLADAGAQALERIVEAGSVEVNKKLDELGEQLLAKLGMGPVPKPAPRPAPAPVKPQRLLK